VDSKFGNSWGGWYSNEPLGSYEVGLWKNIRKFWGLFLVIPNLRWEMTPRLDFDIFRGVGIRPLKKLFHIYVVLLV